MTTPEPDASDLGAFAIPFASAVVKLRNAHDAHSGATLQPAEVKAVVDALKMLRKPQPTDRQPTDTTDRQPTDRKD